MVEEKQKFACPRCKKEFDSENKVRAHIMGAHRTDKIPNIEAQELDLADRLLAQQMRQAETRVKIAQLKRLERDAMEDVVEMREDIEDCTTAVQELTKRFDELEQQLSSDKSAGVSPGLPVVASPQNQQPALTIKQWQELQESVLPQEIPEDVEPREKSEIEQFMEMWPKIQPILADMAAKKTEPQEIIGATF